MRLKSKHLALAIVLISTSAIAQVGINTDDPSTTLDVNGNLRIRGVCTESDPTLKSLVAKDSVLVISNEVIKYISAKNIIESTLITAVKGGFSNSTSSSIHLSSTFTHVPFDSEEFDLNDEFDLSTNTFTAKQDGIYEVAVQINSESSIAAATNYGICILKNGTLHARGNFANITVNVSLPEIDVLGGIGGSIPATHLLSLPVTPPIRNAKTLVQLEEGDEITFQIHSNLGASVSLSDDIADSFFTIVQIR